jgi:hypothetical protein
MSSNGENYTFLIEGRITQFAALLLLGISIYGFADLMIML